MKNEEKKEKNAPVTPVWWQEVPAAEKAVIRDVLGAIRGLKGSKSGPVSSAARKWERTIACFIKFRLQAQTGKGRMRRKGQKECGTQVQTNAVAQRTAAEEQIARAE